MTHYLHFTLGPVQGFVAQSRRTRDLWASSWLLSRLSGEAMLSILSQSGSIILPMLTEDKINDLLGKEHASLPNRFTAEIPGTAEQAQTAAHSAATTIREKWRVLADAVWKQFLKEALKENPDSREIWERQVKNFWEIAWVITDDPGDTALLDQRKNWRRPSLTLEGGDHCTMMGRWQELSGSVRSHPKNGRKQQDEFWQRIRAEVEKLDLADDERLCAIAMVKRLFPKLSEPPFSIPFNTRNWPSTVYLAAVPWLKKIRDVAEDPRHQVNRAKLVECCKEHVRLVEEEPNGGGMSEIQSRIECLKNFPRDMGRFPALDGKFFNAQALSNKNGTPLELEEHRPAFLGNLRDINQLIGAAASPYYALLLMDGDSMGTLLSKADKDERQRIGEQLVAFAESVPKAVGDYDGVTIYAGGDDVLAMLSLEKALACAHTLRNQFRTTLSKDKPESAASFTLSGALLFVHYKAAFSTILREAHHLLDEVAKDGTGRDSLAVAVRSSSGIKAQYSAPWEHLYPEDRQPRLETLQSRIAASPTETSSEESGAKPVFSASFLYRMRTLLAAISHRQEDLDKPASDEPGQYYQLPPSLDLRKLLLGEYFVGKGEPDNAREKERIVKATEAAIKDLLKTSAQTVREPAANGGFEIQTDRSTFSLDAVRLAQFLANGGNEND